MKKILLVVSLALVFLATSAEAAPEKKKWWQRKDPQATAQPVPTATTPTIATGKPAPVVKSGEVVATPSEAVATPDKERKKARRKGFLKGCAAGALMGLLSHDIKSAAIACAAMGVQESRVSVAKYDAQVAGARQFQKGTVKIGVLTQVSTSKVAVQTKQADGSVKTEQAEKLDRLFVPLKTERVNKKDPKLAEVLFKLGRLASEDKTGLPMTITIEGPNGKRDWVRQQVGSGVVGSGNPVSIVEKERAEFGVEVSPIPVSGK